MQNRHTHETHKTINLIKAEYMNNNVRAKTVRHNQTNRPLKLVERRNLVRDVKCTSSGSALQTSITEKLPPVLEIDNFLY